jgi:hypothetical protein
LNVRAKLLIVIGLLVVLMTTTVLGLWVAWHHRWFRGRPPVTAGQVFAQTASFELAVYFLPEPKADPSIALDALLANDFAAFTRVKASPDGHAGLELSARLETDVQRSYVVPGLDALKYFGRGLTAEQGEDVQHARQAFILKLAAPHERVWEANRLAGRLLSRLARENGGLIWDDETREMFTPDAWDKRRIDGWTDTLPDISNHTVVHVYRDGDSSAPFPWAWRNSACPTS